MMKTGLLVDSLDNVAVATTAVQQGEEIKVGDETIVANQGIPVGHKIAIKNINKEEYVYKYGVPIGQTIVDVSKGDYMHTHNIIDITEELCKSYIDDFMKEGVENE
ncbi:UxaA family hydrolase [Tissierella sp. Yu-01]|uniref:UxaA family hydrolase n=1 Tax=Tissierella sp. Yu-01 TaxID=3035694 RepID=UPI00240DE158|nr:UxaA family hydrolase [Tissierella sp. Yu-01]WFA08576.1 UxaA family hydrolase [Tissierella sp. Yu-01]